MSECLYQGSFNPVHNAHLAVAEYVHTHLKFEKIVFIPAFKPPHKNLKDFNSQNALHRLNMVQLAVQNVPYFDVSAIEYTRNMPSYTFDTIVQIQKILNSSEKINFIIGSDAFKNIESWYKTEELKKLVNFILFVREKNYDKTIFEKLKEKGYNYTLMQMPFIDVSSSEIRERCKSGKDISNLVPKEVYRYIKGHDLYKI